MKKRNLTKIHEAAAQAFAAQVKLALVTARDSGWEFSSNHSVGVRMVDASPLAMALRVRIDDVHDDVVVTPTNAASDITTVVDSLVKRWLNSYATKKAS